MSFSFYKQGLKADVLAAIEADSSLPSPIKEFLSTGVDNYEGDDVQVKVNAHGHAYDGTPNNYPVTNATIEVVKLSGEALIVQPVEDAQPVTEK